MILDIKAGPLAGQRIAVRTSESLICGRDAKRAQFDVPHDNHMSGVHFAVECGPSGCRVIDKKSTNGTFLNGAKIQEAMLASGDEIKSGQTVFVVRIVPDDQLPTASLGAQAASLSPAAESREVAAPVPAPSRPPGAASTRAPVPDRIHEPRKEHVLSSPNRAGYVPRPVPLPAAKSPQPIVSPPTRSAQKPALVIGTWTFMNIPDGWQIQDGLGIKLDSNDEKIFPSNIGAMEEPLGPGITLQQYVEAQTKMFREYLREPKIDAALPPRIPGAAETVALEVRYATKDGPAIYLHRVYARSASLIGVLTLTTLEKDISAVRPAFDSVLSSISFSRND